MEKEIDQIEIKEEDIKEDDFSPEELADDSIDWKAKAEELKGIAKRRATQLKKFKDAASKAVEAAKAAHAAKEADGTDIQKRATPKTGELDETQLDYLDLKGVTADEDIEVIQKVMERTGQTVRQALKDEYVQEKLKANQAQREVKAATPSSTKRSAGGQGNDLSLAIAKYEQSGFNPQSLPEDFALRSQVINTVVAKQNSNKPSWH